MKVPDAVGVPDIVSTLLVHDALIPSGNPDAAPMPVAPVVVWVIFGNGLLIQSVGKEEAALTVLFGSTVIVPVAFKLPQSPVNGIL